MLQGLLLPTVMAVLLLQGGNPGIKTRISGTSGANAELQSDTLGSISLVAEALGCAAPTSISTHLLPDRSIPMTASYRSPVPGTSYEQWDAILCGKVERFLVIYEPDPAGGTMIKLNYPYPLDAPIRR